MLAARARSLLDHATLAGALTAALTGASLRPYSRRIGALKGDPGPGAGPRGARRAARRGGGLVGPRASRPSRSACSRRSTVRRSTCSTHVDAQIARELRAVTDSPLYLEADGEEPAGLYPSGSFHSQALSLQLDTLAIAFTQVGNLAEKRLHRLLDQRFSHLPDQLAEDPGRQTGLIFLHKAAIGYAAENRQLASPASVHPVDGSAGQEDFQAFTFLAAEQLGRILDNVELIVASELLAVRQGRALAEAVLPPRLEAVVERLAEAVEPVREERSLSPDVERRARHGAPRALLHGLDTGFACQALRALARPSRDANMCSTDGRLHSSSTLRARGRRRGPRSARRRSFGARTGDRSRAPQWRNFGRRRGLRRPRGARGSARHSPAARRCGWWRQTRPGLPTPGSAWWAHWRGSARL